MKAILPDKTKALIDQQGIPTLPYIMFFDNLARGDSGTDCTPVITNLTSVGTPTITGRVFYIGNFVYFKVEITPSTSTSCVAGTTYITLPITLGSDGACFALAGNSGAVGMCNATDNKIYPAAWTGVTTKVTVTGFVEAK